MALWYIDTGVGSAHKTIRCAEQTARSTGGGTPLYRTVSAEQAPSWRSCSTCSNQIIMASGGGMEEEEEEIMM